MNDIIEKAIQSVMNINFIQPTKKEDINNITTQHIEKFAQLPITDGSEFNQNINDGIDISGNYRSPTDKAQFLKQFNQDFDDYKNKVKQNYNNGIKSEEEIIYNTTDKPQDNYVLLSMGIIMIIIGIIYLIFSDK
jgi:hypothetical protein